MSTQTLSIQEELLVITKLKAKKGEDRQKFLKKILTAFEGIVGDTAEDKKEAERIWEKVSDGAQKWYNQALDDDGESKEIHEFPDIATEASFGRGLLAGRKAKAGKAAKADKVAEEKPTAKKGNGAVKAGKAKIANGDGYKGHRVGSRKEQMHKLFDKKGAGDKAKADVMVAGVEAGLAEGTLRSWMGKWAASA